MGANLMAASTALRQYRERPADEQFHSFAEYHAAARADLDHSKEVTYRLADLTAVSESHPDAGPLGTVRLQSPSGVVADMTHWSFDQLCKSVHAPAGHYRELPASIAAQALNYGLKQAPGSQGTDCQLLVRRPNGNGAERPIIRAATSTSYGRLHDAHLAHELNRCVFEPGSRNGHQWTNAPTWEGDQVYGYRSDRDSMIFQIDGGSIVQDPSRSQGNDQALYRAILVRNSEVGAASVSFEAFLMRWICGNWILWGAVLDSNFRRRHVGKNVLRDVISEITRLAFKWSTRAASTDEAIIRSLIEHRIAITEDAVVSELRKISGGLITEQQAKEAIARCKQTETVDPLSYWGAAQGLTRISQDSEYQSDRLALDQLAAQIVRRGALVAA